VQGGTGGRGTSGSGGQGVVQTNGEIISKNDNSFTLKIKNGGSKMIFFSASTKILKPKQAS
jgi:predicted acetyltransferase